MGEVEKLNERVDALEKKDGSWLRFAVQHLLSPVLLVGIGFVLNAQLEDTKRQLSLRELEVKRAEVVRGFLQDLFSDKPERAFVAEILTLRLVDSALGSEITRMVKGYYGARLESAGSPQGLDSLRTAAAGVRSPAGVALAKQIDTTEYVLTLRPTNDERAVRQQARALEERGFSGEVIRFKDGRLAASVGRARLAQAFTLADSVEKVGIKSPVSLTTQALISPDR